MNDRALIDRLESRTFLSATSFYVAVNGSDHAAGTLGHPFRTIQHALNVAATPGDTVLVHAGIYHERLTMPYSGSADGGYITLENFPHQHVVLSGQSANDDDIGFGENMIQIIDKSFVTVIGLEITNNNGIAPGDDACGIRIQGSGTNIQIWDNTIDHITGKVLHTSDGINTGYAGAGIQVYGSSLTNPYANVMLSGNTIFDCQPGDDSTETLTVNGNVTGFNISENLIHDDNNIGIDMIGGEADVFGEPDGTLNLPVARDGVCEANTVHNIHANYGDGYAAGIYVDGGSDIVIEANHVSTSDLGIEVGCENHGYIASGIAVRANIIDLNRQGGFGLGGYDTTTGIVENCTFTNNTLYHNDTTRQGNGEIWIQYGYNNLIENNIVYSTAQDLLIDSVYTTNNVSGYNLLYCANGAGNAQFQWGSTAYSGLTAYQTGSNQDHSSIFANPGFVSVKRLNFQLAAGSPAINAGDPDLATAPGERDFFGYTDFRMYGIDIGAAQFE